ncbi:MAG: replicative DNA helicase [Phycisphaerae bacterium]
MKAPTTFPTVDRLPPHSSDAERGVLGCMLTDATATVDLCVERLGREGLAFYEIRHRELYRAIVALVEQDQPADLVMVAEKLKDSNHLDAVGGIAYVASLPDAVPSAANLAYYLDTVSDKHSVRRLIKASTQIIAKCYDNCKPASELIATAESLITQQEQSAAASLDAGEATMQFVDELERRFEARGKLQGIGSGFPDWDVLTDGFQLGELAVIGARPSIGKTALACNIVEHACLKQEVPTVFVTLEMSARSLVRRLCSSSSRVAMKHLKSGNMEERDLARSAEFAARMRQAPLHFIDGVSGLSVDRLCAGVRAFVRRKAIKLVIVDYLQKVLPSSRHEKRTYEVAQVSSALKGLADSSDVAVIALAQINRESEKDKGRAPRIPDLADSGQIERDADMIGLLHRPRDGDARNQATLAIAKQRDGETGLVHLYFDAEHCKFESSSNQDL